MGRKPQLVAVATRYLAEQIRAIAPAYAALADLRLIDKPPAEAAAMVAELARAGLADAAIAAGQSAEALRSQLTIPVTRIRVGGYDIMQALIQGRGLARQIAIVTRQGLGDEFAALRPLLNLDLNQYHYASDSEAEQLMRRLAIEGDTVIIGSSQIVHLASQYGLPGALIYSETAIQQAFDDALERVAQARDEAGKREQLTQVLASLSEGVVAVDGGERVLALNPAAARLIGVAAEWAQGRPLSELAPALSLQAVLATGQASRDEVVESHGRTLVVNRQPLHEAGQASGALLTFQEASRINDADRQLRRASQHRQFRARWRLDDIAGAAPQLLAARELAELYARSDAGVLIGGESGCGKELFAQGIHLAGARAAASFVAINCAALPESLLESELFGYEEGAFTGSRRGGKPGLIELAHGGTLFLDEIGDMPLPLQTRLLRVLQAREVLRLGSSAPLPVDIRVIAASHVNLAAAMQAGRFRADLYYRLNILALQLPPLRQRPGDSALLAGLFIRQQLARQGSSLPAEPLCAWLAQASHSYPWPGNVRELENICERLCAVYLLYGQCQPQRLAQLVPELQGPPPPAAPWAAQQGPQRRSLSREQVQAALAAHGGDQSATARSLGISRSTLWRKLKAEP